MQWGVVVFLIVGLLVVDAAALVASTENPCMKWSSCHWRSE